jgi:hypothetical protein
MTDIRPVFYLIACLCLPLSAHALAADASSTQSYESCSVITGEYLTILQLSGRGLSAEILTESLPDISEDAARRAKALARLVQENGLTETYSTIYSEYATCAKNVYENHGIPESGSREDHFFYCAGENKIRYEISVAAIIGAEPADVISQLPPGYGKIVRDIFSLQQSAGSDVLFDTLATELKHCINGVM